MTYTASSDAGDASASSADTLIGKVVVFSGADREAVAHCRVLLDVLRAGLAREVVLAIGPGAGANGLDAALDAPDVGLVEIDGGAPWHNPLSKSAEAWKVARMIEAERPDMLHAVGLKPAALAALALQLVPTPGGVLVHLPDLGALGAQAGGMAWPYRKVAVRLLASLLRRPGSFLLVGCDEDLAELRALGIDPGPRFAVVGGPGIDPDVYPVLPPAPGELPVAACVGAAGEGGGVRELMQAFERLWARGLRLQLELHGGLEGGSGPAAEWTAEWTRWSLHPGVRCSPEWPADAREVWRRAEICVWPVPTRQGLPRALLEAAACGRALIVADAPGAVRAFARHDVEGLIVPPATPRRSAKRWSASPATPPCATASAPPPACACCKASPRRTCRRRCAGRICRWREAEGGEGAPVHAAAFVDERLCRKTSDCSVDKVDKRAGRLRDPPKQSWCCPLTLLALEPSELSIRAPPHPNVAIRPSRRYDCTKGVALGLRTRSTERAEGMSLAVPVIAVSDCHAVIRGGHVATSLAATRPARIHGSVSCMVARIVASP